MAKGKKRSRHENPQPFLADNQSIVSTKSRSKAPKHHQKQRKLNTSGMSSKILKEALIQQKEIEEEDIIDQNPNKLIFDVIDERTKHEEEKEEDIDKSTQTQFGNYQKQEIDEDDEKLLEAFFFKNAGQQTLVDLIIKKIKQNDATVSSEAPPLPKLDDSFIEVYKGVGKFLNRYTTGKLPKVFKHIPSMQLWEDVLYLTEPENWSPNAMYEATRIFASNLGAQEAGRFYSLVLLPRVREEIRKNKRLHFALYQALIKAMYKPGAFNEGILFPLCKSGTCSLREAVIIGSIIQNVSIPNRPSMYAALLELAGMEYCGTTSYFIKLLLKKIGRLSYKALDAIVAHFMRFLDETRIMPVIWHQSLLAFVQRYKDHLKKEDKDNLRILLEKQKHKLVTPEITRELDNSCNRGHKKDDLMLITSLVSVFNKTVEEDTFDIPDVPMEED